MTDFTDTIETTAESVEDLQQDLEAHLENILGFSVTVDRATVEHDEEYGDCLEARIDLEPMYRELERRLDADEVSQFGTVNLWVTPTIPDGDPE